MMVMIVQLNGVSLVLSTVGKNLVIRFVVGTMYFVEGINSSCILDECPHVVAVIFLTLSYLPTNSL
jgi:hypothetical protein